MKHLSELTLNEFEQYKELLEEKEPDWFSIFQLFGEDTTQMDIPTFTKYKEQLENMELSDIGVFREYAINGKTYKCLQNITKMKAAQFIDFQSYLSDNKLHEILSIFLIPTYEVENGFIGKLFKMEKVRLAYDYGVGYDIKEVQDDIYNHFTIGKAHTLSAFFLLKSTELLECMKDYLEVKVKKMKDTQK